MVDKPTSSPGSSGPGAPEPAAIRLRAAEPGDAALLRTLYASTRADELSLLPPGQREAFLELQWRARQLEFQARHPDAKDHIVMVDGVAAGRLLVARREGELVIVDIALLPEFRGRGAGSQVLRRLLDEAASGGTVVRLHVALANPALRLYRRLGFRLVRESGLYALLECGTNNGP